MRLEKGARKLSLFLALALLTGCAGKGDTATSQVDAVRETYRGMTAYTASALITANCEGRIYEYEADYTGTPDAGTMTVTAPENLAGCSITWDANGLVLDWEEVELDTGTLNADGLTPVDAMAAALSCCQAGLLLECSLEAESTELYAEFENPNNANCTAQCWFDLENHALKRADLTSGGETLVTLQFSSFTLETASQQGDTAA